MRICAPQLGLSPVSILGGEIYDREILKYFAKRGVICEIILPFGKPHRAQNNWQITFEPVPFVVPPHLYSIYILPYLLSIYSKRPFDILRVHSPVFVGPAAAVFRKIHPQVPIIGVYHWLGEGGQLEQRLNPYLMSMFDCIICDSKFMKKQIEQKYIQARGKVHTIYNGVDEALTLQKKSKKLLRKYKILEGTIVLLYMGLFIERKNPQFLLPLVRALLDEGFKVKLLLCGSGPLERDLSKNILESGIEDCVNIIPPVFGNEKNDLLNVADVFVHPALNEGFSLAVIEAMACGLPVVISKAFSASEAVTDKINGFLCSSQADWLRALRLIISSPALRIQMRKANIAKVNMKFRWPLVAEQQLTLFKSVLNTKKIQRYQRSSESV